MTGPAARSLEYWAQARPDAIAAHEGGLSLTWRDWNEHADLLADAFVGRGLGYGDVIAVRCRNRLEWLVIASAAAKIDAAILALDPDMPVSLVRSALIAGEAAAFICDDERPAEVAPAVAGLSLRLCASLDTAAPGFFDFWELFGPAARPRFASAMPALIGLTAGVAGLPAGVALRSRRAAPATLTRAPVADDGAQLITLSLHRTWAHGQLWSALSLGRRIVLMRRFEAAQVLDTLASQSITHWHATPAAFASLATLPASTMNLSGLVELVIGGAPATTELKAWIVATFGPILTEIYGSTETGPITIMPAEAHGQRPGSCGRPDSGVRVEIRDADGRRLPPNAVGQVWARTQRSLECDLLPAPVARRLRDDDGFIATSDAGRVDEDGFLFILGRADGVRLNQARRLT